VHELEEMKQMGLSVLAISEVTGYDRKTVWKYLLEPEGLPSYGPRGSPPSKLDAHKPYLEDRLTAGVWNAQVLLRELRQRGYDGGYGGAGAGRRIVARHPRNWRQPREGDRPSLRDSRS
jgi:transposase